MTENITPDPIAYGPTGYRCGCGKDAHSNLVPCHPDTSHRPMTLYVGTYDCLERECAEYLTEDGYDDPGVERCSHVLTQQVCAECSTELPDETYESAVAWPCSEAGATS